jgi:protoporphyrinogen IX oxidase
MVNYQGWILVFHVLGIVLWVGSLLVVTQLMAAHADAVSPDVRETLAKIEGKIFGGGVHLGAIVTIISGILMFSINPEYYGRATWMHIKLALVLVFIVLDALAYTAYRKLRAGGNLSRGRCMALHGTAALVFAGILIMVLVRPFGG